MHPFSFANTGAPGESNQFVRPRPPPPSPPPSFPFRWASSGLVTGSGPLNTRNKHPPGTGSGSSVSQALSFEAAGVGVKRRLTHSLTHLARQGGRVLPDSWRYSARLNHRHCISFPPRRGESLSNSPSLTAGSLCKESSPVPFFF